MDGRSFDSWTRSHAAATNRRTLLGWSLTAGVASVVARIRPTSAQFGGEGSCTYSIALTSSVTAGATVTGSLVIDIGSDGAIDTGSLTLTGQPAASVVGQATGPAIDLLVALADGSTLSLTGIADAPISSCSSPIFGSLANFGTDQVGTWQALPGDGNQVPTPTPTPVGQSQDSSSTQAPGGPSNPGGSGCPPTECGSLVLDQQTCQCVCGAGTIPCGANCCPSGSGCSDPNQGICGCPGGTTQCGTSCVPDCFGDEFLNFDTCQCEANQEPACIENNQGCSVHGQCCSGYCANGTCFTCFGRVCGDFGCIDPSIDSQNCGNCGNVCIGTTCQNGVCQ